MRRSCWLYAILVLISSCLFDKGDSEALPEGRVTIRFIKSDDFLSNQLASGGSLKITTENADTILQEKSVTGPSPKATLSSVPAGLRQFSVFIVEADNKPKYKDTCSYVVVEGKTVEINIAVNQSVIIEFISHTDFRITDELEEWSEMDGGFATYEAENLKDLINGGADQYANAGLTSGIFQNLEGNLPDGKKRVEAMIMDLGLSQNAKNLFQKKVNETRSDLKIGAYPPSVAKGWAFLGGVEVFAHFNNFYFEISVSGYEAENIPQAVLKGEEFLLYHEKKLSSN